MPINPGKLNSFLLFKLPAAYFCGVRVKAMSDTTCEVSVKHRWINQNPFNSMYFAVQAMAAELSTGALVMQHIQKSKMAVSMLVASNKSTFSKKATGRIQFKCVEGNAVQAAIQNAIDTKEGQTFWLKSVGINADGVQVSEFYFEWTVKAKAPQR